MTIGGKNRRETRAGNKYHLPLVKACKELGIGIAFAIESGGRNPGWR
jgi:hypothetical protein